MDYYRFFPRYNVFHLEGKATIPGMEEQLLTIKDISLGGIQIQSQNKIVINDYIRISLHINTKENYELYIKQIWIDEVKTDKGSVFRSGYKLKFLEKENFSKWTTLLKALHLVRQKKRLERKERKTQKRTEPKLK